MQTENVPVKSDTHTKSIKNKLQPVHEKLADAEFLPEKNAVYLISCVSKKINRLAIARDLYVSAWYRKARAYVERRHATWFILSAEYGLVAPDQKIAPYEKTLNNMGVADRRRWAEMVIDQMGSELPDAPQVVLFAGQRYREFLMDYLRQRYSLVIAPLARLGIGEQLSWFDQDSPRVQD